MVPFVTAGRMVERARYTYSTGVRIDMDHAERLDLPRSHRLQQRQQKGVVATAAQWEHTRGN